jgi:hypothetical protein
MLSWARCASGEWTGPCHVLAGGAGDEWTALVLHQCRVLRLGTGGGRVRIPRVAGRLLVVSAAAAVGATSCSGTAGPSQQTHSTAALIRLPASATSVLTGAPDAIADGVAQALFASAPVVVVANPSQPADVATAASQSLRAHAPLLLTSATGGAANGTRTTAVERTTARLVSSGTGTVVSSTLRAQIRVLDPRAVLAVGVPGSALAAQLPGIRVVTDPAMLPRTTAPTPASHVVLLVHRGDGSPATLAAITTARVAGAQVIAVRGNDPRTDPAAITALAAARPQQVLAVGAGFGPAGRLAPRIAVAETGVQLPGGGQVMFPMRLLVALYGNPGTPALGVLGQQGLQASIARARRVAAAYRPLSHVPVVPAFEIIATVAQAHPGYDGYYSYETPLAELRPWVRRAIAARMYVILDLQPGRASLLAQAKRYQSLLRLPDVGLALDGEWKLQPGQLPLQQIGSVRITEINSVIRWLAGLTARYRLPQKLLVLHQFRLSMIQNEQRLDTRYQDLAILIHMDGQGTPANKEQTWEAVTAAAPPGVFFGWKDFYVKDHPMLDPRQTIERTPHLSMISYQ